VWTRSEYGFDVETETPEATFRTLQEMVDVEEVK
jgi:hypothetical protein